MLANHYFRNMTLKDKVIVVTGGTGVLGNAFLKGIVGAQGKVCILGRNKAVAEQRAQAINEQGGEAIAVVADVLNEQQLSEACDSILDKFGAIHGLVNAAGGTMPKGFLTPDQDLFDLSLEGTKQVAELNLYGTIIPTHVFGKAMVASGGGSIINISSMASDSAVTKVLGYSLGKAGIDIYTKWFALEAANRYGEKLRVNAIAPGFFLTEQNRPLLINPDGSYTERSQLILKNTPYKRFGQPEELNGALIWLLSDESKFVTGTIIKVDGGFSVFSGV